MNDFVAIRGYSNYVINKDGRIMNIKTNKLLDGGFGNAGYKQVRLTSDLGVVLTWGLHRLLAWVFKANFENISGLVINHKDGNKLNNDLDNLEIVTYQENVEHAGLLGLSEKCKPVSVKNIITGLVKEFPSAIKCAREFNLSKDAVLSRCHRGDKFVYNDLRFKFGWDEFKDIELESFTGKQVPILVRNVFTGEVEEFPSSLSAAVSLNVSPAVISKYIRREDQPIIKGFVQIQSSKTLNDWIDHPDPIKNYEQNNDVRCVKVWDRDDNMTLHFSAKEAARYLNISTTCLNYRLSVDKATKFKDGTKCTYY